MRRFSIITLVVALLLLTGSGVGWWYLKSSAEETLFEEHVQICESVPAVLATIQDDDSAAAAEPILERHKQRFAELQVAILGLSTSRRKDLATKYEARLNRAVHLYAKQVER